ncbi:hypothetical protein SH528x_003398 [Novipirellula sp. SH528]|uniref:hypothetical protein n=1 Tax=Novipirellula sp. SH528 TaxID=3454466 RepID=UPI003F9FD245
MPKQFTLAACVALTASLALLLGWFRTGSAIRREGCVSSEFGYVTSLARLVGKEQYFDWVHRGLLKSPFPAMPELYGSVIDGTCDLVVSPVPKCTSQYSVSTRFGGAIVVVQAQRLQEEDAAQLLLIPAKSILVYDAYGILFAFDTVVVLVSVALTVIFLRRRPKRG